MNRNKMKINHGESEFEVGQTYTMTLKDQGVLDYDDDEEDINDTVQLENTHLQSSWKRRIKE